MNRRSINPPLPKKRTSEKVCKYAVLGCPIKNCVLAHSIHEFKSRRRNKEQHFLQLVSSVVQQADSCPYEKDCPGIYCPYDYDKSVIDWTDESIPDFDQPLVFKK
jgi:hypothetical protein